MTCGITNLGIDASHAGAGANIVEWPESSNWKTATAVACAVVIGAAAISWQVYSARSTERKLAEDARTSREGAERGDAKAESRLAYLYSHGLGVPQDYGEALCWLHKAADQKYPDGEDGLGYMYVYGLGVPQDFAEALHWYRKAADQGDAKGEDGVALMYDRGRGVPRDYAEALRWYRKSADQGYASAEYNLGNMYFYGRGVSQDRAEAVRWYRKAADQGDEYAQRVLHWKWKGLSPASKISLGIGLAGSLLFGIGSLASGGSPRGKQRRKLAVAGLIGVFYVTLSLLGFRYIGILTPVALNGGFRFIRGAVAATWVAILLRLVMPVWWTKAIKIWLGVCGLLFLGLNSMVLAKHGMGHALFALGSFWLMNSMLLGTAIPLAIFLWLEHRRSKLGRAFDGEISEPDTAITVEEETS